MLLCEQHTTGLWGLFPLRCVAKQLAWAVKFDSTCNMLRLLLPVALPGDSAACMQLKRSQVVKLLRQGGMRGPYGAARGALVKWLLETGSRSGPDPSPATVRGRAVNTG